MENNLIIKTTDNNFNNLSYIGESLSSDVVIFVLEGKVNGSPTKTSIQIGHSEHIEDNWGRFMNHNCNPNCKIINRKVISIKVINKEDLLTFNYNVSEDKIECPFKCNCCGELITGNLYI